MSETIWGRDEWIEWGATFDLSTADKVDRLRKAGFSLGYAWQEDALAFDRLGWSKVTSEYYAGHRTIMVTGDDHEQYGSPFVDLGAVAKSEDRFGQSSTIDRSNYSAIREDYSQMQWVDVSYINVDCLGAFVQDMPDDIVNLFVGLATDYPVYSEDAMGALESEEIHASWGDWLSYDLRREGTEPFRSVWDRLGDDAVASLFWEAVSGDVFGNYPEHNGLEVIWGNLGDLLAEFRPIVLRAYWSARTAPAMINDVH